MFDKLHIKGNEEEFNKYIKIKGKFLYLQFYNVFLRNDDKVMYDDIKTCIIYDKNLRDTLYIYLATFEEYLRAQILDNYELTSEFIYDSKSDLGYVEQLFKHVDKVNIEKETSQLYSNLNIDLGQLIKLVSMLEMFDINKCDELNEIRQLRNKVMHHNVLVLGNAKNYNQMLINKATISKRIKILAKYLPEEYGDNFLEVIRRLSCDREDYKVII